MPERGKVHQVRASGFGASRWRENRRHWNATLDPANLGRRGATLGLERELALYATAEVRAGIAALGPLEGRRVLMLGDGFGLMAILLARRGALPIVADVAPNRLAIARGNLTQAGFPDVAVLACAAESIPLPAGRMDAVITRSVLIHTDLPRAAAEIARVLRPGGVAVFVEPTSHNPLVAAFRLLLAPKVWAQITTWFDEPSMRTVAAAFPAGSRVGVRRMHLLGFLASLFTYAVKAPGPARAAESLLAAVDAALFRVVPRLRRRCWFVVMRVRKAPTAGVQRFG